VKIFGEFFDKCSFEFPIFLTPLCNYIFTIMTKIFVETKFSLLKNVLVLCYCLLALDNTNFDTVFDSF
jgi:hypothetical protein